MQQNAQPDKGGRPFSWRVAAEQTKRTVSSNRHLVKSQVDKIELITIQLSGRTPTAGFVDVFDLLILVFSMSFNRDLFRYVASSPRQSADNVRSLFRFPRLMRAFFSGISVIISVFHDLLSHINFGFGRCS